MRFKFVILLLSAYLCAQKMNAQARGKALVTNPVCDCKLENGKNTIVFGGALTYQGNKFTAPSTNRFQFLPQFQITNKSTCTLTILNVKLGANLVVISGTTINAGGETTYSAPFETRQPVPFHTEGGGQLVDVTVKYKFNNKMCTQQFTLLYYNEEKSYEKK